MLAIIACASAADPTANARYRVLFIGNSLTYTNELPATLAALAATTGDTMYVKTVAEPDLALIDHINGASNALDVIRENHWDFVVLQQGPSSLPANRDTLIQATKVFDPSIRAAGARTALYMVWPASNFVSSFNAVRASYQAAAQAVDGIFLPGGEAWRTAWQADAQLQLYGPDGFHPAPLGTYLVALVMYEKFTGKDARELPAKAVVAGRTLNVAETTIRLLQRAAHETNATY